MGLNCPVAGLNAPGLAVPPVRVHVPPPLAPVSRSLKTTGVVWVLQTVVVPPVPALGAATTVIVCEAEVGHPAGGGVVRV